MGCVHQQPPAVKEKKTNPELGQAAAAATRGKCRVHANVATQKKKDFKPKRSMVLFHIRTARPNAGQGLNLKLQ
jgi:hypothetical protein